VGVQAGRLPNYQNACCNSCPQHRPRTQRQLGRANATSAHLSQQLRERPRAKP
jgi:hypothetical protein